MPEYNVNNDAEKVRREIYSDLIEYDNILDYELLEDGAMVADGRTVAKGAILFGTAGAVIANSIQSSVCTNLQLKVTLKDSEKPVVILDIITEQTDKSSEKYKALYKAAQITISKIQQILSTRNNNPIPATTTTSNADEIRKYKGLLDDGIITEEEFNAKKKELLGL